jgi:[ribosomal protein S5]-alanine N-acetyltransferase
MGLRSWIQRLELRGDADNEASRRVAERCGYTLEGILRSVYFKEGRRSDMFIYSRLQDDE